MLFLFYRWRHWALSGLNNFPRTTWLLSGRGRVGTQICFIPVHMFLFTIGHCFLVWKSKLFCSVASYWLKAIQYSEPFLSVFFQWKVSHFALCFVAFASVRAPVFQIREILEHLQLCLHFHFYRNHMCVLRLKLMPFICQSICYRFVGYLFSKAEIVKAVAEVLW